MEQANSVAERKIDAWKLENKSTHWSEALLEAAHQINSQNIQLLAEHLTRLYFDIVLELRIELRAKNARQKRYQMSSYSLPPTDALRPVRAGGLARSLRATC